MHQEIGKSVVVNLEILIKFKCDLPQFFWTIAWSLIQKKLIASWCQDILFTAARPSHYKVNYDALDFQCVIIKEVC